MRYNSLIIAALSMSVIGCGKDELKELEQISVLNLEKSKVEIDVCTTPAADIQSRQKFIFVVDKSGSNKLVNQGTQPGTDIDGNRRYNGIKQFVQSTPQDPDISFSLVNFNDNASIRSQFETDNNAFLATLDDDHFEDANTNTPVDSGWTNYLDALDDVRTLITNDIDQAKRQQDIVSSSYVIFFLSDGAPIVNQVLQDREDIRRSIESIRALADANQEFVDLLQLNTIYYFGQAVDIVAETLLFDMSVWGRGVPIIVNSGEVIDFSSFAIPTRQAAFSNTEIFIENTNLIWSPGGQLLKDSDSDGLADINEPPGCVENPDCDGNQLRDGVEYMAFGSAINNSVGNPGTPFDTSALCAPFAETDILSPNFGLFFDRDNDQLNDCEEVIALGSSPTKFDSNNDLIPDLLATRFGVSVIPGLNDGLGDPDSDGLKNREEIKAGTPINRDNGELVNLEEYKFTKVTTSTSSSQTCYHIEVDNIATMGSRNNIRVHFLEGVNVVVNRSKVRVGEKSVRRGGTVRFSNNEIN